MTFINNIQRWWLRGSSLGFLIGFALALEYILRHSLIQQNMLRLMIYEGAARLTLGILGGLVGFSLLYTASRVCGTIWSRFLKPSIEVRFIPSGGFHHFVRALFLLMFVGYGVYIVLRMRLASSSVLGFGSFLAFVLLILLYGLWNWGHLLKKIPEQWERRAGAAAMGTVTLLLISALILHLAPASGPNILLVVPDALRSDHLGIYGYSRRVSPKIDAFAGQSVVFENAMSNAPWTKPSMGTLLTSQYPFEHGALNWTDSLVDGNLTMAEYLRNANYATYGIQTNPALTRGHNFHQGFQRYVQNTMAKADQVVDTFLTWMKTRKTPFFAYLHFMDTHVPYNSPHAFTEIFQRHGIEDIGSGQYTTLDVRILTYLGLDDRDKQDIIDLYDNAVRYFDHQFGRLLEGLAKTGELDDTIVVLLSDHGEEFWEHGGFAHGQSLYREVLQVPLMIRYPKKLTPKRVAPYVSLKDVLPTVLHLLERNGRQRGSGRSLLPKVFSARESFPDPIFCEGILYGEEKKGAIWDGWKIIENTGLTYLSTLPLLGDMTKYALRRPEHKYELYDLHTDVKETLNLVWNRPERLSAMKNKLSTFSIRHELVSRQTASDLEKKTKDMRTLGYIK